MYFVLLIHRLRPGEYGDFAYAVSWLSIFVALADGGFSRLLLRDVGRAAEDRPRIVWELLGVRSQWLAATAVLVAIAIPLGAFHFGTAFSVVLVLALVLEAASLGFEAAGQAADSPWVVSAAQLVAAITLAGWALVLLLRSEVTTLMGLAGIAAASAVRLAVQAWYWFRRRPERMPRPGRAQTIARLREALPYLLLAGLAALYYRLDVVVLHQRRGAVETAPYAAAYRVVDAVLVVGGVVFVAIAPHMSRVMARGKEAVWSEWRRYVTRVGCAAVLTGVVIAILAEPLSRVLFGERYAKSAGENLTLLAPGITFMLMHMVNAAVVLMADDKRTILKLSVANVTLNLAVTWVLAGAYGARGASVATSLAEAGSFVAFALLVRARYRPRPAAAAS